MLGDRAVFALKSGRAPMGARGTVVGVMNDHVYLLLDEQHLGATTLEGRCSLGRGIVIERGALLNLSVIQPPLQAYASTSRAVNRAPAPTPSANLAVSQPASSGRAERPSPRSRPVPVAPKTKESGSAVQSGGPSASAWRPVVSKLPDQAQVSTKKADAPLKKPLPETSRAAQPAKTAPAPSINAPVVPVTITAKTDNLKPSALPSKPASKNVLVPTRVLRRDPSLANPGVVLRLPGAKNVSAAGPEPPSLVAPSAPGETPKPDTQAAFAFDEAARKKASMDLLSMLRSKSAAPPESAAINTGDSSSSDVVVESDASSEDGSRSDSQIAAVETGISKLEAKAPLKGTLTWQQQLLSQKKAQ